MHTITKVVYDLRGHASFALATIARRRRDAMCFKGSFRPFAFRRRFFSHYSCVRTLLCARYDALANGTGCVRRDIGGWIVRAHCCPAVVHSCVAIEELTSDDALTLRPGRGIFIHHSAVIPMTHSFRLYQLREINYLLCHAYPLTRSSLSLL
jgi:hypothetical protein